MGSPRGLTRIFILLKNIHAMCHCVVSLFAEGLDTISKNDLRMSPVCGTFVDLHWLPIKFRVQFKLLLIVCNQAPHYINDLLSLKTESNYSLRSSGQFHLSVPRVNCSIFRGRAFTHAAPVLWNSLPLTIRSSSSTSIFKKRLKTFLFKMALNL